MCNICWRYTLSVKINFTNLHMILVSIYRAPKQWNLDFFLWFNLKLNVCIRKNDHDSQICSELLPINDHWSLLCSPAFNGITRNLKDTNSLHILACCPFINKIIEIENRYYNRKGFKNSNRCGNYQATWPNKLSHWYLK